ncbi:MAG TPA: hypothetical protein VGQ00_03930 [Candidatus Norongarragalinales archaeon]|jgi:hypothetical protein|nr:hypothetical protein [Candidatus Norongarragalinales archaeon]
MAKKLSTHKKRGAEPLGEHVSKHFKGMWPLKGKDIAQKCPKGCRISPTDVKIMKAILELKKKYKTYHHVLKELGME